MTKTELRRQIFCIAKKRSDALHKEIMDAIGAEHKRIIKLDPFYASMRDKHIRAMADVSSTRDALVGYGLKGLKHLSASVWILEQAWMVQKVDIGWMIPSSNFVEIQSGGPSTTLLAAIVSDYRAKATEAVNEFKKALEIVAGMKADKAFKALKDAGLPLEEATTALNLPATNLLLNVSAMIGGETD